MGVLGFLGGGVCVVCCYGGCVVFVCCYCVGYG